MSAASPPTPPCTFHRKEKAHGPREDPPALLAELAVELLAGESFTAACAELAGALILDGTIVDYSDALARRIPPVIVADGWQSAGDHPSERDIAWEIANVLRHEGTSAARTERSRSERPPLRASGRSPRASVRVSPDA